MFSKRQVPAATTAAATPAAEATAPDATASTGDQPAAADAEGNTEGQAQE